MSHTDSMDRMYRKHSQMIYAFLLSRTGEAALAEELTQETFYQAVNSFKGQSSSSTWLCGIANNVWLSHLRKQKRSGEIFSSDEDEACFASSSAESPEDKFIRKADNLTLMQALHEIKEPMREVLYLRLMGELSFREIGQIMGQSENWARVTFYRGKKKLIEGVKIDE